MNRTESEDCEKCHIIQLLPDYLIHAGSKTLYLFRETLSEQVEYRLIQNHVKNGFLPDFVR